MKKGRGKMRTAALNREPVDILRAAEMEVLDLIREIKRELAEDRLGDRFDRFEYKPV